MFVFTRCNDCNSNKIPTNFPSIICLDVSGDTISTLRIPNKNYYVSKQIKHKISSVIYCLRQIFLWLGCWIIVTISITKPSNKLLNFLKFLLAVIKGPHDLTSYFEHYTPYIDQIEILAWTFPIESYDLVLVNHPIP